MKRGTEPRQRRSASARPVQSVTSAPQSAADDQGERIRRYLTAMGLRLVCSVLALLASGWLRWTFVVAAVILPYIAVVLANAVGPRTGELVAPVSAPQGEVRAIPGERPDRTIHGNVVDD